MLYPYQQKLIDQNSLRCGIFYDTGLGKTVVALKLAEKNARTVLIICPKSLKENWKREIGLWISPDSPIVFAIISKEDFRKRWDALPPTQAVIVDEFHFFGNYKSQLHKTLLKYLTKHQPKCIWGLTATPILSSVMSVWALSRLLGKAIGTWYTFQSKYFYKVKMGAKYVPMQKAGIERSVARDLRSIGVVVSKDDARLDLPDQVHKFEYFDLTKEQKKMIKDLDKDPTTIIPIVYHTKCLQIANGTIKGSKISLSNDVDLYDTEAAQEIKCEKLSRVLELVQQHKKCIIVARHTAELKMLQSHIPNSYIYDGHVPEWQREEILDNIRKNETGVLLLQSEMGIGFNLQEVNVMIFYSHTWDFVKYTQCLGRIHRIGQKYPCTYIHLLVKNTIDEDVWKCLERKESFDVELYQRNK